MLVRPIHTFNSVTEENPDGVVLSPSDILRDTNPHVKLRPDLFEEVVATVRDAFDDTEDATARPGGRRNR